MVEGFSTKGKKASNFGSSPGVCSVRGGLWAWWICLSL